MGLAAEMGTVILGTAYAVLIVAIGLWLADYVRPIFWAQAAVRILAWVAAALVAGHLLAAALLGPRPLFLTVSDFLAAASVGMLVLAPVSARGPASRVGTLALALAALTPVLAARPDAPTTVDQQRTLLYVIQAALHALGTGGCGVALLGSLDRESIREGRRLAHGLGIAVMGGGFVLTSAWAWLNWGVVWRNDPRLNLLAAGWLCIVAGEIARRDGARWGLAAQWLGIALMLAGVFVGDFIAAAWPGLSFVAW